MPEPPMPSSTRDRPASRNLFVEADPDVETLAQSTADEPARSAGGRRRARPGDSLGLIAAKTGLSIDLLQAYNPTVNPNALTPGQRLNLWRYPPQPPKPKAKPPGPMFWTVRPGQSFGSIAAATGINIVTLEQLNPRLKPVSVQPGDRLRLRR